MTEKPIFSFLDKDSFKTIFTSSIQEIVQKYNCLMREYIPFINKNLINNNKIYLKFIIIRGLETITNVFNIILFYTKNLDLTFFYSQKAFYYYVEFIEQISNDKNSFLNLTSREAVMYVYKKTIFLINKDFKKMNDSNLDLDLLNEYININKLLFIKILSDENEIQIQQNMELLNKINTKINSILLKKKDLELIKNIIHKNFDIHSLYDNITNIFKNFQ